MAFITRFLSRMTSYLVGGPRQDENGDWHLKPSHLVAFIAVDYNRSAVAAAAAAYNARPVKDVGDARFDNEGGVSALRCDELQAYLVTGEFIGGVLLQVNASRRRLTPAEKSRLDSIVGRRLAIDNSIISSGEDPKMVHRAFLEGSADDARPNMIVVNQ